MGTIDRIKSIKEKATIAKTCPICGAAPKLRSSQYDPWGDGAGYMTDYWYECGGCGIIKAGSFSDDGSSRYDERKNAETEAAKDWNEVVDYVNDLIEHGRKPEDKE